MNNETRTNVTAKVVKTESTLSPAERLAALKLAAEKAKADLKAAREATKAANKAAKEAAKSSPRLTRYAVTALALKTLTEFTVQNLAEKANKLFVEFGGSDNEKEALQASARTADIVREIGLFTEKDGKFIKA
jgi:trimethylamine:corrinoid methyltransferase-like protein